MNSLKILLKNNFNIFLGALNKKNKKNRIGAVGLVIGAILVFGAWFAQSYFMFKDLASYGLSKVCLFNGINISLTVLVIMGVMRTAGKQKTNDSDLLLSLPIKKSQIVLSKLVNLYLLDLSLMFIILVPYVIIYQIFTSFSLYLTLMSVLLILLLPLLSVAITHIIGFFVTRFINTSKNADFLKTMFSSLIMALVLGMMIYKNVTTSNVTVEEQEQASALLEQNDRKKVIQKTLKELPKSEALLLTLFYLQECTIDEISQITGLSNVNVKTKLFRARKHFYSVLEKEMKNEIKDLL